MKLHKFSLKLLNQRYKLLISYRFMIIDSIELRMHSFIIWNIFINVSYIIDFSRCLWFQLRLTLIVAAWNLLWLWSVCSLALSINYEEIWRGDFFTQLAHKMLVSWRCQWETLKYETNSQFYTLIFTYAFSSCIKCNATHKHRHFISTCFILLLYLSLILSQLINYVTKCNKFSGSSFI